jgi:hypothetical protein
MEPPGILRRCVIRVLLKDANRVGIIVVVAVEIGLVRRFVCDPGFEMLLPNASNLVEFPRERPVFDEQCLQSSWPSLNDGYSRRKRQRIILHYGFWGKRFKHFEDHFDLCTLRSDE